MAASPLAEDPLWPRAAHWIERARPDKIYDLGLLGVPAHLTSITSTGAHETPRAVREALARYSTYSASHEVDLACVSAGDFGDVNDPDGPSGEERTRAAVAAAATRCSLLVVIGGDNSLTYSAVRGMFGEAPSGCGLVTVDAHHDLRDGSSNGSPVRRLTEAGLPGANIVQVGIADFSNSPAHAARARELGITVVPRAELRGADSACVVEQAMDVAGTAGRPVFVDIDVDVCDRAEVPGCPSAAPGGLSADELRRLAFEFGQDPRVRGIDLTEIDATTDTLDGRTVRLAALLVLEAAAGFARRSRVPGA